MMDFRLFLVLFGLILVVIIVLGVIQYFVRRRKIAHLIAVAAQRGWHYTPKDRALVDRFDGAPFGSGYGRRARHVLEGTYRGRNILAFEYTYKESSGTGDDSRESTYYFTVAALATPAVRPKLQVTREGMGRKLLGLVGIRDLQLESEEFNKTFHIRTDNDKFAYDILHPRMMEWMLADGRAMTTPFRFERADLVTWKSGPIEMSTVDWLLDFICDVMDRTPDFVWKST